MHKMSTENKNLIELTKMLPNQQRIENSNIVLGKEYIGFILNIKECKGFGFIRCKDFKKDLFFSRTQLREKDLKVGSHISFNIKVLKNNVMKAINIYGIKNNCNNKLDNKVEAIKKDEELFNSIVKKNKVDDVQFLNCTSLNCTRNSYCLGNSYTPSNYSTSTYSDADYWYSRDFYYNEYYMYQMYKYYNARSAYY